VIYHVVCLRNLHVAAFKGHDAVANKLTLKVDSYDRVAAVVLVDLHGYVRYIFACVGFTSQKLLFTYSGNFLKKSTIAFKESVATRESLNWNEASRL
jgi:hypothetical protein